ncbi:MAG: hypothetical protein J6O73_11065 [Lachnospiraceae bacterium]|nr:hypothetical protein [Lachnospiraceae bacterium]
MAYEEFSLLDTEPKAGDPGSFRTFYRDLNLDRVIDRLIGDWGKGIRKYYGYLPVTQCEVAYRQAIYADVKKQAVHDALIRYVEDMTDVDRMREEKGKVFEDVQKAVWHLREIISYCLAYERLFEALTQSNLSSEGMQEFVKILGDILEDGGYRSLREEAQQLMQRLKELRFIITYEKDRICVACGEVPGDGAYAEMLRKKTGGELHRPVNPFRSEAAVCELEKACIEILEKKRPEIFREMKSVAHTWWEYEVPVLRRFDEEIRFYLSYHALQQEMLSKGFPFATPILSEDKTMEAHDLYDIALALASLYTDRRIVCNDFSYQTGEQFFVLTGPNQGGKTTFARSLGQLVYFARLGLDVPAASARLPFFPDIQTHFSVEESVETGKGKLKEELTRLAPMMESHKEGTFIIINELFTTAASYDAKIMGKRVLKHFIGLGCMGIYVTHIAELAAEQDGVVSLRAMLNDQKIQTYKIRRGQPDDTACAENLVSRYGLTYEQLKERL